jgi:hypothetical protein
LALIRIPAGCGFEFNIEAHAVFLHEYFWDASKTGIGVRLTGGGSKKCGVRNAECGMQNAEC